MHRKSQIALEFSYRYRDKWPGRWVFWIHAGTKARFLQGYRDIATRNIPDSSERVADILSLVRDWLSDPENGPWLIVIDNADDSGIFFNIGFTDGRDHDPLSFYIPQPVHGDVLVTSRNHAGADLVGNGCVEFIEALDEDTAVNLLTLKLPTAAGDPHARELVNLLDSIPLAISQAAAFVCKTRMKISKYVSIFKSSEEQQTQLLIKEWHTIQRHTSNAIITSWKLLFDRIRSECSLAADTLAMMSMMDRQGFAETCVFHDDIPELDRHEAIGTLLEYSLIQQANQKIAGSVYSMHRLVQVFTRACLKNE